MYLYGNTPKIWQLTLLAYSPTETVHLVLSSNISYDFLLTWNNQFKNLSQIEVRNNYTKILHGALLLMAEY